MRNRVVVTIAATVVAALGATVTAGADATEAWAAPDATSEWV
jgi:7-cyano-7-deazaguanine synthase in queuosine biosynthesis